MGATGMKTEPDETQEPRNANRQLLSRRPVILTNFNDFNKCDSAGETVQQEDRYILRAPSHSRRLLMRLFLGARLPQLAQLRFAAPLATVQARSARPLGAPDVGTSLR